MHIFQFGYVGNSGWWASNELIAAREELAVRRLVRATKAIIDACSRGDKKQEQIAQKDSDQIVQNELNALGSVRFSRASREMTRRLSTPILQ